MGRNLFEVAARLANRGVGERFARARWIRNQESPMHWSLTRIQMNSHKNYGEAWGVFYNSKQGQNNKEQKVRETLKRDWRLLDENLKEIHRNK
mmetsp:Transcript_27296/g.54494  ORF Transcript_27296/g.54494 Transcript_27296/m.54494 type:complete len:93 (+) Transcript_27296:24-302(+)